MYFFPDCQSQGWRRCKRTVGRISPGRAVVYIYQSMLYASAVDATPKTKKDERL